MVKYIKIKGCDGIHQFPLKQDDGPLLLSVLRTQHPSAQGLVYSDGDDKVVVSSGEKEIEPPSEGWDSKVYVALIPQFTPTHDAQTGLQDKLLKMLLKPRTQLVMAPERKITPFDGKPGDIQDFISNIGDAFQRYTILGVQRGSFLVDYLRGVPKLEAKALLADGQTVDEVLVFLKESYGDKRAVGEFQ